MSATDDYHKGLIEGFHHARKNPDQTIDEFIADLDHLRSQLEALPKWKLRLIAGKGTFTDRLRFTLAKKTPANRGS